MNLHCKRQRTRLTFAPPLARLLISLLTACSAWSAPGASPVAWWNFNDPGNPGLDSIGGNTATLQGTPLPGLAAGHSGLAVDLNGSGQYLRVADAPALELTGPMTIAVWARANAVNKNYPFVYKATSWNDGQMAYALDLNFNSGGYYPRFWVSSDGFDSGYMQVVSPVAMDTNTWHLIAGVYDGSSLTVYMDGQAQAIVAYSAGIYAGHDPLYIGRNWNATWNGQLDDVLILNGALTPAEMLALYQGGVPPLAVSLSGIFGRAVVGQARTNQVVFSNLGTNPLTVVPELSGPDASNFQLVSPAGSFLLQPGVANSVTGAVCFVPDAPRAFTASLTVTSSANTVQIPLIGRGVSGQLLSFLLEKRDPVTRRITQSTQSISARHFAILVVDVWNSHPDPEMASRTAALVPRMNQALDAARALGIQVIFCPTDVPLPAGADRSVFATLLKQTQVDTGFLPPLPPYTGSSWGDMVPIPYDLAHGTRFPAWSSQHPDLVVKPGDLASVSRQEIYNFCAANGIDHLLYLGAAANMGLCYTHEFSMVAMKRYCGLEPVMVRDLTESMTLNGRFLPGNNDNSTNINLAMSPDLGHRQVTASNETYICSTIDARQLMAFWPPALYTDLVAGQANLLHYWRMDSQAGYREILDVNRQQSCWWNYSDPKQMAGLTFGVPGALTNDPDTAVQFTGSSTLLLSPIYRVDVPTNLPITSLSATNFSLELWVRIDQLNRSNQWFYAHDDGTATNVDVLLGLNAANHFQFVVGRNTAGTGWGDIVVSSNAVTQADVDTHHWFHLVAEHSLTASNVLLYVDASGPVSSPHRCKPVKLSTAPHLGSRGAVQMGTDGNLSNLGFEGLHGALDEVAVYSAALNYPAVALHYAAARGIRLLPSFSAISLSTNGVLLSFSGNIAKSYLLQTSTDLRTWQTISTNLAPAGGLQILATAPGNSPARFFRAIELP